MNDDTDTEVEPEPGLPRSIQTVSMSTLLTYAALGLAAIAFLLSRDYEGVLAVLALVPVVIASLITGMALAGAAIRWNWQRKR